MSAAIRFIRSRRDRLKREEARELHALLATVADDENRRPSMRLSAMRLQAEVRRELSSDAKWEFVMISPKQNALVARHIRQNSARPAVCLELWALCLRDMDWDTGEVLSSRHVFAKELGVKPAVVSRLIGELVKCGVLSRSFMDDLGNRTGTVRWFVNPRIGTHLRSTVERDAAQREAPELRLVERAP